MKSNGRKIQRSDQRIIAGVCSGLAEYFRIEPWIVRIIFLILAVIPHLTFLTISCYLILIVLIPPKNRGFWQLWRDATKPKDSTDERQPKRRKIIHDVREKNIKD
ncbi:PspC domain-containing protein [Liquorilactobacillus sicerae]|uniref:PspC domain-containing protein n=1 Tax=Liquorilactobacillus sicerae TaxID=1416943 RepID=UPI00248148C2